MDTPAELRYSSDHEWIRVEESKVRVGITDFAQDNLGDVVFVQIPEVGDAEPTLKRPSVDADLPISVQRPTTKYEARGMRMGSPITELIWERL